MREMTNDIATEMKGDVGKDLVGCVWMEVQSTFLQNRDVIERVDIAPKCRESLRLDLDCVHMLAATGKDARDDTAAGTKVVDGIVFADVAMSDKLGDKSWATQKMLSVGV